MTHNRPAPSVAAAPTTAHTGNPSRLQRDGRGGMAPDKHAARNHARLSLGKSRKENIRQYLETTA